MSVVIVQMPFDVLTHRVLFSDGRVLDVQSPHADSRVSGFALTAADKQWGKDPNRIICGLTVLAADQLNMFEVMT